jgi:hypothetical protein
MVYPDSLKDREQAKFVRTPENHTAVRTCGEITIGDGANLDSFSRLRVSSAAYIFDGQLTYDLQPILFEQITSGSGTTITHDATNRMAVLNFASTPSGGQAIMQTFEHFRYTPGRSQLCFITFDFNGATANTLKFAGYSDGTNGIEFQNTGSVNRFAVLSATGNGNQIVNQSSWNIDRLDGTGNSGLTLDITKTQILVIDLQALYVGRVRVGFDIEGKVIYVHQFTHANKLTVPYIATANLPVRVGMTCTGTSTTTMNYICCSVIKEDGNSIAEGYHHTQDSPVTTVGNNTRTHVLSIQPKTTFNGITNRTKFILNNINLIVTGNGPVHWELCLGDVLTGTTTFNDVNTTYSGMQFNTAGTTSGTPAIVLACGFVAASAQAKGAERTSAELKYPICLNAAGAARPLGRLTLLVSGVNAPSACVASITWTEIR